MLLQFGNSPILRPRVRGRTTRIESELATMGRIARITLDIAWCIPIGIDPLARGQDLYVGPTR